MSILAWALAAVLYTLLVGVWAVSLWPGLFLRRWW